MSTWSEWSDWAVDPTQNLLYRVRQDHQGNLDYEYNYDYGTRAETPRGDSQTIEALTAQLDSLSPGSNFDSQDYELNSGPQEKSRSSKSKGKDRERDREKEKEKSKEKSKDKSKENSKEKNREKSKEKSKDKGKNHQYDKGSQRKGHSHSGSTQQRRRAPAATGSTAPPSQTHYAYDAQYYTGSGYSEPAAAYATTPTSYDSNEATQLQQAVILSQQMQYGITQSGAGSSSGAYTTPAYASEPDEDESTTPKGGAISADEDQFEEMDPRYRIEPSSRFQPGEIFKVYWSEPQGSGENKHPSVSGRQEIQNRFGMKFFVGFRRFIVIANDQGHCTCVPILTYGGKGCNKSGVKPSKHGIIYEYGHRARTLDGEPKLGFPAVQARITEDGERLSKESRVNYSKLITVEHNVNVFFIGSIMPESWVNFQDAVNDCWCQKTHQRRRN
ncbi:hypothetical protein EsDP_00004845 [Epichloe bromicola]|uniref:DUF6590 domain-containing protein n=1 Tax=Epichloe bromicola TaxID=79588 RepID=A0ABQ0CSW8_9HYPO